MRLKKCVLSSLRKLVRDEISLMCATEWPMVISRSPDLDLDLDLNILLKP